MTLVREAYPQSAISPGDRKFLCGTELEIEAIKGFGGLDDRDDLVIKNDGSLRNNGKEFCFSPMTREQSEKLFKTVHDKLDLGPKPFSFRTSIHVHVNVQELELKEARQLVLTYALFEPLFFKYVGDARKHNIFCVPLNFTYLPKHYRSDLQRLVQQWQKYTAFNLCRIKDLGTMEFRHLYGTADLSVYSTWLTAIEELYTYIANTKDFNLLDVLNEGVYQLAREIVPTFGNLYSRTTIESECADSLLDVKLAGGGIK